MSTLRLPYFWKGMGFCQKAAYLCSTSQARDYSDACRILGSMKKKRPRAAPANKPAENLWYFRD